MINIIQYLFIHKEKIDVSDIVARPKGLTTKQLSLLLAGSIALTSLAFVSCGGDSGEKEAPNTIKYVDLEGQEQEEEIDNQ